jgi:hypothetical protein
MVSKSCRSHTQTHAGRRDHKPALPQFVGNAQLPECRLLERERNDHVFDLLSYAVLQHRLLAADLLQRQLAAVCRQSISDSWLGNLREYLAHLV